MAPPHRRVPGPGLVFFGLRPRRHTVFALFPLLFHGAAVGGEPRPGRLHPDGWRREGEPAEGNGAKRTPKQRFHSPKQHRSDASRAQYLMSAGF